MAKKKINPRYIDANLVKEALLGWDEDPTDEEIEYAIDNIPTADVVKVVRCKDCKYGENGVCTHIENITHSYDCDDNVYDQYIYVSPEHFCSYGDRK